MAEIIKCFDLPSFLSFLAARAQQIALVTHAVPLPQPESGRALGNALAGSNGASCEVVDVKVSRASRPDDVLASQPMIVEAGGFIGLVLCDDKFLVRCEAQAGSYGYVDAAGANTHVLVSASLQIARDTLALHQMAQSGDAAGRRRLVRPIPLAHLAPQRVDATEQEGWVRICEGDDWFYRKTNLYTLKSVETMEEVEATIEASDAADFAWISPDVLCALRDRGLLSSRLLIAMALLW